MRKVKIIKPSRLLLWLLKKFVRNSDSDFAVGDLTETFSHIVHDKGKWRADLWLWMEVLRSVPGFLKNIIKWRMNSHFYHIRVKE